MNPKPTQTHRRSRRLGPEVSLPAASKPHRGQLRGPGALHSSVPGCLPPTPGEDGRGGTDGQGLGALPEMKPPGTKHHHSITGLFLSLLCKTNIFYFFDTYREAKRLLNDSNSMRYLEQANSQKPDVELRLPGARRSAMGS